jgi:predicted metallo-beta-lactamase superfamily hydrolase
LTIEKAFLELMPDTVTWYKMSATDAYGKHTFNATANSQRCRVERSLGISQNAEGKVIAEDGKIYFFGTSTIGIQDKLVLPDGTVRVVLRIETSTDTHGAFATMVTFGKVSGG